MRLAPGVGLILALAACTSAQGDRAAAALTVACQLVVAAEDPALTPLCSTIDEAEAAVKALGGQPPLGMRAAWPRAVVDDRLYRAIQARRAKK